MYEIIIPKLGLDTLECEIQEWLINVGDMVEKGKPILEVESEKAVIAIEAEVSGVLSEIYAQAGETVPVGSIIGLIEVEDEKSPGD